MISKPWMSRRDVNFIDEMLCMWQMDVLEYGSGGSTLYFPPKARSWFFVEHNGKWFNEVVKAGAGAGTLAHDMVTYCTGAKGKYDLIIVDGVFRVECLRYAHKLMKEPCSFVLVHDARRREYLEGVETYKWHRKVGDDLIIMSDEEPRGAIIELCEKNLVRASEWASLPWDPIHESEDAPFCGFNFR